MDRQAFKQRMQNLKSYRENNPGKGYWDWKVETFADGGVNDNLIGSYSNHTGTPTMYVPVTKEYEAVPEGFGEIANIHAPEVTITPQSNISLVEAVDKGRRDAAPYVGAIVAGATLPAMSSTNMLGKAIDLANIVLDPTNPANYVKIPNIRLGRWSAKFPEYGNQNKAFRQVNVDAVDDYINTGVVGPESKAHNAMRSAQNANKNSGDGSKHLLTLLTKHFDTHVMFNKTKPFYGKDSKYPRVLVGDLRNPRINWKKVNHKGHKNIVEPVDPSAGNFTVPIEEFDIWRKAKIGWLRDQKANRFAEGGQTGDPSIQAIEQRAWLNNWLKNRSKQMSENIDFYSNQTRYGSSMDRIHVSPFFFQDKEKNASKIIQEQLQHANNTAIYDYREPWVSSNKNIPNRREFLKMNSNVQGAYHKKYGQPNTISISPIATDRSVILHELSHSTQDKYSIQSSKIDDILKKYEKENNNYDKYYDNPDEIYSRMNQFRYDNNIKPEDIITEDQIEQWKDSSIDNEFINRYSTNTLLDLLNSVAYTSNKKVQRIANGGEIGDPEKERFYQATGRSSSGRPLEEGLKPVFSLEDAANMTPIGDAVSARDTYNAVKNRDWLGAGLAALTVLPFVPSGLRNVKAAARYIPTVNRTEQSLINQALGNISKKRDYLSDIANSRNRVLEDINTIPYRNRAEQADKIFGTNYSETYDLLDDLYQHRYFDLPEVQPKDMVASGRLQAKPFAEERFNKTGVGAEPNEFDLWVNTGMYRDPMQLANHEMNHYTDYIISRNANTSINNNMLKQLENSLKQTDATGYYRKGTEQKAYMNQLRTMLKQNGDIQNLDEPVSSTLLKKYLDKMSDSDPIKKMFKQHKNINAYTKWFNTIPLLSTTALGANAYFNNNKDE